MVTLFRFISAINLNPDGPEKITKLAEILNSCCSEGVLVLVFEYAEDHDRTIESLKTLFPPRFWKTKCCSPGSSSRNTGMNVLNELEINILNKLVPAEASFSLNVLTQELRELRRISKKSQPMQNMKPNRVLIRIYERHSSVALKNEAAEAGTSKTDTGSVEEITQGLKNISI